MKRILFALFFTVPALLRAAPATFSVGSPDHDISLGEVGVSSVTVDVGTSSVLGAADFAVSFDTTVANPQALKALAAEFQNNFFFNQDQFQKGNVRVVTLNDTSTSTPSGLVSLARMDLKGGGVFGSSTSLNAQVFTLSNTQGVAFSSPTVLSGRFRMLSDRVPPRTSLVVGLPSFSQNPIYVSSRTFFGFLAADDRFTVGDGQGVGVQSTQFSIDNSSFTLYAASFTVNVEGLHSIAWFSADKVGNMEVRKSTTVFVDNSPPTTRIAFSTPPFIDSQGNVFIASSTLTGFTATDSGSGVALTEYRVDASSPTTPFQRFSSSFTLTEGIHLIEARSTDNVGNLEVVRALTVRVDVTPPVSRFLIGAPQSLLPNGQALVSAATFLNVVSTDPVSNGVSSGLKDSFVSIDTAPFAAVSSSFTLAGQTDGPHTIHFYSRDNVLNAEVAKSTTVVLDATPPVALLLSPSSQAQEMDQVFGHEVIPILATVTDLHFRSFTLSVAAGRNATSGFTTLITSTVPVSSAVIFNWNAANLNGYFTLKLDALDTVGNVTAVTAPVFIGNPTLLLTLENDRRDGRLDKPEGVAVDIQGNIFVANTGRNEVLKFNRDGALLAAYKGGPASDHSDSGMFDKPAGLAVDAIGNVYVADQNNHRIAVLNSNGTVIQSIGRKNREGEFVPGRGPGEFNHPTGVAVSSSVIVVADRGNKRVQVLDNTGRFLFDIKLSTSSSHSDGDDDRDDSRRSRPFGIALDGNGNIYVTDDGSRRVLAFDSQGRVLFSVGTRGFHAHEFEAPRGIAASLLRYLYVADRENQNILKIDPSPKPVLSFGLAFGLRKPVGAALDNATDLYVTDAGGNKVFKFGLNGTRGGIVDVPAGGRGDRDHEENRGGNRAPGGADASFALRAIYVFPNPARGGSRPTLHIEAGLADRVTIRIYDAAGREVNQTILDQAPTVIDDGNGAGPQFAYEYTWDAHVPTGVYLYQIDAEKAGSHLTKSGKLAVIR